MKHLKEVSGISSGLQSEKNPLNILQSLCIFRVHHTAIWYSDYDCGNRNCVIFISKSFDYVLKTKMAGFVKAAEKLACLIVIYLLLFVQRNL